MEFCGTTRRGLRSQFAIANATKWTSDVGQRVSFFVIAGKTYDEIYEGFRTLTGDAPMLPKSAYGYIQCKQRYSSQAEIMGVAKGYRERHLPIDELVIDWFHVHEDGADGYGSGEVAGSCGDAERAACDELSHDDQRVAAVCGGEPILSDCC